MTYYLSSDGVTWSELPAEPKVEFDWGESVKRGDSSLVIKGSARLTWFYADEPLTGDEMYFFQAFVGTAPSADVYLSTKTLEVDDNGEPVFRTFEAIMKRPTFELETIDGLGQRFLNVSIDFFALVLLGRLQKEDEAFILQENGGYILI